MLSLATSPNLAPASARPCSILGDSVLSSSLHADDLHFLEMLGEVVSVPSGTVVFEAGSPSEYLYVVLDGALLPVCPAGDPPPFWVGPGDVCGEVGFALGTRRGTTMAAFGPEPRLWRIHRDVLADIGERTVLAATRLLAAISRVLGTRLESTLEEPAIWTEAGYVAQVEQLLARRFSCTARELLLDGIEADAARLRRRSRVDGAA